MKTERVTVGAMAFPLEWFDRQHVVTVVVGGEPTTYPRSTVMRSSTAAVLYLAEGPSTGVEIVLTDPDLIVIVDGQIVSAMEGEPTPPTTHEIAKPAPRTPVLMRAWLDARHRAEKAVAEVGSANEELRKAANALGERINPGDQKPNEKLCLWIRHGHGGSEELLVESTRGGQASSKSYAVRLRGDPK